MGLSIMSLIAKILNTYTNSQGDPEIHFVDDLGKEYTLAYRLEWILEYFNCGGGHPLGALSELEERDLEGFLNRMPSSWIDPFFSRYVNADMNWRPVVELEFQN
jgi:hypothetical protein